MKKYIACALLLASHCFGQQYPRWYATTGDVSLSSQSYAATIQQSSSSASGAVFVDKVHVYCSVACTVTFYANGQPGATTTAGTVTPLLPTALSTTPPFNFFTASNATQGTQQGPALHLPGGAPPTVICFSKACGETQDYAIEGAGTQVNLTASIASMSGTVNVTFFTHTISR